MFHFTLDFFPLNGINQINTRRDFQFILNRYYLDRTLVVWYNEQAFPIKFQLINIHISNSHSHTYSWKYNIWVLIVENFCKSFYLFVRYLNYFYDWISKIWIQSKNDANKTDGNTMLNNYYISKCKEFNVNLYIQLLYI